MTFHEFSRTLKKYHPILFNIILGQSPVNGLIPKLSLVTVTDITMKPDITMDEYMSILNLQLPEVCDEDYQDIVELSYIHLYQYIDNNIDLIMFRLL